MKERKWINPSYMGWFLFFVISVSPISFASPLRNKSSQPPWDCFFSFSVKNDYTLTLTERNDSWLGTMHLFCFKSELKQERTDIGEVQIISDKAPSQPLKSLNCLITSEPFKIPKLNVFINQCQKFQLELIKGPNTIATQFFAINLSNSCPRITMTLSLCNEPNVDTLNILFNEKAEMNIKINSQDEPEPEDSEQLPAHLSSL